MKTTIVLQRGAKLASLTAVVAVALAASAAGYWFGTRHAAAGRQSAQSATPATGAPAATDAA